jgi:hypothetical protein
MNQGRAVLVSSGLVNLVGSLLSEYPGSSCGNPVSCSSAVASDDARDGSEADLSSLAGIRPTFGKIDSQRRDCFSAVPDAFQSASGTFNLYRVFPKFSHRSSNLKKSFST